MNSISNLQSSIVNDERSKQPYPPNLHMKFSTGKNG
jgi:hypothetical protein